MKKNLGNNISARLMFATLFVGNFLFAEFGRAAELPNQNSPSCGEFQIHASISESSRNLLAQDLILLNTIPLENHSSEIQILMNLDSSNAKALRCWLRARAQLFLGDSLRASELIQDSAKADFKFPNSDLPLLEDTFEGTVNSGLLASNVGALGYLKGKVEKKLKAISIPGVGWVDFTSARVGLIQLSEKLFAPLKSLALPVDKIEGPGNSIYRLGALFHEARHSDGNRESLSFLHNRCPQKHDYASLYACDLNLNGPYTIEGTIVKHLLSACKTCSVSEKEALRLNVLDSFSRVILSATRIRDLTQEEKANCESLKAKALPAPEVCFEKITAKKWDSTAEGLN